VHTSSYTQHFPHPPFSYILYMLWVLFWLYERQIDTNTKHGNVMFVTYAQVSSSCCWKWDGSRQVQQLSDNLYFIAVQKMNFWTWMLVNVLFCTFTFSGVSCFKNLLCYWCRFDLHCINTDFVTGIPGTNLWLPLEP
jgi:hypothetical protein